MHHLPDLRFIVHFNPRTMKLTTSLLFAATALATASEIDNLGPEWEPVDLPADGAEQANAHRALGENKLLSCRRKCDASKKGREIKVCEYLIDGKYEVKKWEYWSERSVCWGGDGREPWSSSSTSSCRDKKKKCKKKCNRRLLGEDEGSPREVRCGGSRCFRNSCGILTTGFLAHYS